jgi:Holliday junction resolvasome RuvABC DNA-binding subunit
MVVELRDKILDLAEPEEAAAVAPLNPSGEDAVKALVALGIRRVTAEEAVRRSLAESPEAPASELTRQALSSIKA